VRTAVDGRERYFYRHPVFTDHPDVIGAASMGEKDTFIPVFDGNP
jgi:hypothetical protein